MRAFIKSIFLPFYYSGWYVYLRVMNFIYRSKITNYKEIPIIINNRNRLTFLLDLITALEDRGYYNIFIIDNKSDYEPLLSFYKDCKYKVFRLDDNVGFLSLWKTDIYKQFQKDYFVYTDSDVVPVKECPENFLETFLHVMKKDHSLMKIGLSLKIDDLPDWFDKKKEVIAWEKQYHNDAEIPGYYRANVDTTFALYRPFMSSGASRLKMYRSKFPLAAYHMPWYINSENLTKEELYYINSARTTTHWTKVSK